MCLIWGREQINRMIFFGVHHLVCKIQFTKGESFLSHEFSSNDTQTQDDKQRDTIHPNQPCL